MLIRHRNRSGIETRHSADQVTRNAGPRPPAIDVLIAATDRRQSTADRVKHRTGSDAKTPRCGAVLSRGSWRRLPVAKALDASPCPSSACFGGAA